MSIFTHVTQRGQAKHAMLPHSNGKCKHPLVFKDTLPGAIKARKRSFVKVQSNNKSYPSNKKDFFSPVTVKEKQKY